MDTARLKVLSHNEKTELLKRTKAGDAKAREELINGNLKLVLSVIKRFTGRGENLDDLFQVGCIGLIKSIDNFDVGQNVQFSTYAVPMIIGEIRRYLRDNSAIRVSRSVKDVAYRTLKAKEALMARLGREPTVKELSEYTEIPEARINYALEAISEPVSLYDPVYSESDDSVSVMDQISDPDSGDDSWTEQIALFQAIKNLEPREKRILSMRYFDGKTQMEVAQMIDISQAQVSRLEKAALTKIKKML